MSKLWPYLCLCVCLCLFSSTFLTSHEGHHHPGLNPIEVTAEVERPTPEESENEQFGNRPDSWTKWFGSFHFIFLHFPIALIVMAAISELLFVWNPRPIFDYAARFMLITAAILATPTALFGLIYSYTESFEGLMADFFWWHMWLGIATATLAIVVAFMREKQGISPLYYVCLFVLFLLVNTASFLGGGMVFGPYHLLPPI